MSLAINIFHLHLAMRSVSPSRTSFDSWMLKSFLLILSLFLMPSPLSVSSLFGFIIHCHSPMLQSGRWPASAAHLFAVGKVIGCLADPTHMCSLFSSPRISVATPPSSRIIVMRSVSLLIFILSPHGSHAMPPRVPYLRSSGTLLWTPDRLVMSAFTPASTSAISLADTFMNLSLYAAISNMTAWHMYLVGRTLICFNEIRFVLLSTSCLSVFFCSFDPPYASW